MRITRLVAIGTLLIAAGAFVGAQAATAQAATAQAATAQADEPATAEAHAQDAEGESAAEEELDAVHHVADGYYLDFTPGPKIELPRILLIRDEQGSLKLEAFASTTSAMASGRYHVVFEDQAADDEHAAAAASGHDSPLDGTLVRNAGHVVIDLSITRHLVFVWIVSIIVLVLFTWLARRYTRGVGRETAPRGRTQNMLEALITYVRDEIAVPNIGEKAHRYVPFLLSLWFFILFANLFGLIPLSSTSTANITITGVLALFTFVVTQASGKKDYWAHIFWPPGIPAYVKPILVPIEFLGIFIKPFVLAVRLFANMTAGHLVILSLLGLGFTLRAVYGTTGGYIGAGAGVLFALFIYLIELLVAFLQAYIFVMLSALYIGAAVEEHDHHHDEPHATHNGHALAVLGDSEVIVDGQSNGIEEKEPALVG